jgi:hypothetical protein
MLSIHLKNNPIMSVRFYSGRWDARTEGARD